MKIKNMLKRKTTSKESPSKAFLKKRSKSSIHPPIVNTNNSNVCTSCSRNLVMSTRLLSVSQTAEFLDLSVGTVYQKSSKGELPVYKVGRKIYFDREELEKLILDQKNKKLSNEELAIAALNYCQN